VDFGSAKVLTAAFLNQANFPHCHIQGHATDSWESPSFDLGADLVFDDCGNRKGWFDLTAFNFRWLRILIPGAQALDSHQPLANLQSAGQVLGLPSLPAHTVGDWLALAVAAWRQVEPATGRPGAVA
jgi:hypothetical protein